MVSLIDYTLDEALRRGANASDLNSMLPLLQKYQLEAFDVSLQNLVKSGIDFDQSALLPLLRCRVNPTDEEIAQAKKIGITKVSIIWSNLHKSRPISVLESALGAVSEFAEEIYLCIDNAPQYFYAEFDMYWPVIDRYRVNRLIYWDSASLLDPFRVNRNLTELQMDATCPIEFCGYNALGLATANSLAALRAGVGCVGTSVGGVGLQGRAAMEEVLMAVKHLWRQDQIPAGNSLAGDCERILAYMKLDLPVDKAIIGSNVFAHESGIHVDGIVKNPMLYELIRPEEVGLTRKLVIGKHSGTASIKNKFREWNLDLRHDDALILLEKVREIAETQKRPLTDLQLQELFWIHATGNLEQSG